MKIAILTFYRAANFGGLLQAYALRAYLTARGHEVVFVEDPMLYPERPRLWKSLAARSWTGLKIKLARYAAFRKTRFAARAPTCGYDAKDIEAVIVGSDQVWNPDWYGTSEFVEKMFLGWSDERVKRIAYGPSFGRTDWTHPETVVRVGELLRSFERISVREQSGIDLVRKLSGRGEVPCLLDPTLLFTAEFYRKLVHSECIPRNEVLVYQLDWSAKDADKVTLDCLRERGGLRIRRASPGMLVEDWLKAFAKSEFVVTNSFHGTCFALLFHRPFVALKLEGKMAGMNERLTTLLEAVGLEDRFVDANDMNVIRSAVGSPIDWELVDDRLAAKRSETDRFFKEMGL